MEIVLESTKSEYLEIFSLKDLSLIPQNVSESKPLFSHKFEANAKIFNLFSLLKKLISDALITSCQ